MALFPFFRYIWDKGYCNFIFPSLIIRGNLSIGICTNGASPSTGVLKCLLLWSYKKKPIYYIKYYYFTLKKTSGNIKQVDL